MSIATVDGPYKNCKSSVTHLLEEQPTEYIRSSILVKNAVMVDAMVLLQSLSSIALTFVELRCLILYRILSLAAHHQPTCIDFVVDSYMEISIKCAEVSKRPVTICARVNIYENNQPKLANT